MLMFRSGSVSAMVESRIFWFRFTVELRLMPMLEKLVLQLTDEVRVDCVIDWGLYIEVRLFGS